CQKKPWSVMRRKGRSMSSGQRRAITAPKREYLSDKFQHQNFKNIPEPKHLDEMIKMAEDLANGFHQVRVDLYNIDGKIYFSEMTFTAACGRMESLSDEVQLMMGQKIHLPPKQR
ncbi:MAG: hypothetical protein IIT40_07745, partial [Prevotella sp.]|nr:hypothetical protein [Prevotella sp.]